MNIEALEFFVDIIMLKLFVKGSIQLFYSPTLL